MRYTFKLQTMKASSRNVKNDEIYENILFVLFGFSFTNIMIHRTKGEVEAISLAPLYQFHPFHRHLDIS